VDRQSKLEREVWDKVEAERILQSQVFKAAISMLNEQITRREMSIHPTDVASCQDVVRVRQLMAQLEKCLKSIIRTGEVSQVELKKLTEQPRKGFFQRSAH